MNTEQKKQNVIPDYEHLFQDGAEQKKKNKASAIPKLLLKQNKGSNPFCFIDTEHPYTHTLFEGDRQNAQNCQCGYEKHVNQKASAPFADIS